MTRPVVHKIAGKSIDDVQSYRAFLMESGYRTKFRVCNRLLIPAGRFYEPLTARLAELGREDLR